jgi:hypothetical protein
MKNFWKINKEKFILLLIIFLGAFFRLYNLNWDQNQHLHPDERFLIMTQGALKIPAKFEDYLNPKISTLNPYNTGNNFFVYGTFPLTINMLISAINKTDAYDGATIQGRFLSAFVDILVILLIFNIIYLFEKQYKFSSKIKLLGAFFYAILVLPIQLSHFFAVDTFLNLFLMSSLYLAMSFYFKQNLIKILLSGVFLGAAFASKISAIYFLPLILFFISYPMFKKNKYNISYLIFVLIMFIVSTVLTTRIADPHMFEKGGILNLTMSNTFIGNIKSLQALSSKDVYFPPAVQWINKTPIIFALTNIIFFGVGLPIFIFFIIGVVNVIRKYRYFEFIIILIWFIAFFLYQSFQFSDTMRYFINIYPFLAIFAGFGFYAVFKIIKNRIILILLILITLIWPLAFISIYTKEHARVTASKWIYANISKNDQILEEHWDDPLPLNLPNNNSGEYKIEYMPVFGPDDTNKQKEINNMLYKGKYIIFSSNRGWGSISTVPERYPFMVKLYDNLFKNRSVYKKIKEFTSYPSLRYMGIPVDFPDDWAEEAFTVYDHPKVDIFKKN